MTRIICVVVAALLSGVLGYPASPSTQSDSQPLKSYFLGQLLQKQTDTLKKEADTSSHLLSHPDITQVITSRPQFFSEFNVRQDPPPSEDDLQRNRRRRDLIAEASSAEEEDDDSDMYMEPIEIEKTEIKQKQQMTTSQPAKATPQPVVQQPAIKQKDNQQMGQHFFPSFAPVFSLGHSRPHQLFHQEPFYSKPRSPPGLGPDFSPFRAYRDSSYKVPITIEDDAISTNILGSGNFGVLRGGTYYNEDDEYGGLFSPHYSNNGHGRPYYSNPRPQKYSNGDFFANFRDFADINTPTKASYSQYVVVYVNKNATKNDMTQSSIPSRPKNIFEQLTLLDQNDPVSEPEDTEVHKKQSLHKRKLAIMKQESLMKQKKRQLKNKSSTKDLVEPLLALS